MMKKFTILITALALVLLLLPFTYYPKSTTFAQTVPSNVPTTGLTNYWNMDEATGTTVADAVGGKTGSSSSSTNITTADKKLGTAARTFDGINQYIGMGMY